MNSVRICWRRRSSETSSRTSHAPLDGARRARIARRDPSGRPMATSPIDDPEASAARASVSTPVSRNASMSVRPIRAGGSRSSMAWADPFAETIRSPSSTCSTPTGIASMRASWSRRSTADDSSTRSARARSERTASSGSPWSAPAALVTCPSVRRARMATSETTSSATTAPAATSHASTGRAWHTHGERCSGSAPVRSADPWRGPVVGDEPRPPRRGQVGERGRSEGMAQHEQVGEPRRGPTRARATRGRVSGAIADGRRRVAGGQHRRDPEGLVVVGRRARAATGPRTARRARHARPAAASAATPAPSRRARRPMSPRTATPFGP